MIQRKLRVGYNRAARMIELMEKEGTIGPADGAKPREVYTRPDI
jgi:S-DNA-T family DNA segregation ATPase FtsK/SpoIIIE